MDPRVTERRVVSDLEHLKSNPRIFAYFACVTFFEAFMFTASQKRSAAACECQLSAAAVSQPLLSLHSSNQRLL